MSLFICVFQLGGGCSFLAALSTAIAIGRPLGIGLVSLAMSLSITFTVGITKTYSNMHGSCKDEPHCWRRYMQVYAVCCAVLYTVGTLALALYRRPPAQDSSRLLSTDHGSVVSNAGVGLEAVVDKEFATNEEPLLTQPGFTGNARSVSTGSKSTMSRPGTTLPGVLLLLLGWLVDEQLVLYFVSRWSIRLHACTCFIPHT